MLSPNKTCVLRSSDDVGVMLALLYSHFTSSPVFIAKFTELMIYLLPNAQTFYRRLPPPILVGTNIKVFGRAGALQKL